MIPKFPCPFLRSVLVVGLLLTSESSLAQSDVNPPMPNVLLLVDTSGSMEYKSSIREFPSCDPDGSKSSERSRWIDLVEVLTGSIQEYRCDAVDRSSTAFSSEYALGGIMPADFQYQNPYHRPLSGSCAAGPGSLPTNAFEWSEIAYHQYDNPGITCSTFRQSADGIIDAFGQGVRFGLMTFDTRPESGTGYIGSSADYAGGVEGSWSYFVGSPSQGKPAACYDLSGLEVGARNAAAPPWEGRMVAFGNPNPNATDFQIRNDRIQKILLTTRPYGGTPIAGMLHDAREFLWNDDDPDPLNPSLDFGPKDDPYIEGGCRETVVLLLTDGEPNLDLRPFCEGEGPPSGVCPYDKPEDIARSLSTASGDRLRAETYVVGFALDSFQAGGTSTQCEDLTDADLTEATGLCATEPNNKQLQVCCTLNRIAFNGGGLYKRALFASDKQGLRAAIQQVLSDIIRTTSRTQPVVASGANARDAFAASYRFFSSFKPKPFSLWQGVLERQRFTCEDGAPTANKPDPDKGDDFIANVNSGTGDPRKFYSVVGDTEGGRIYSERSIRPALTEDSDGAGFYQGLRVSGGAAAFVGAIPAQALTLETTSAACSGLSESQCKDRILRWTVGLSNGTEYHRCPNPGGADCNLIGDIFHSTPRVFGPPKDFIRDESYQLFATEHAGRPTILLASTNDGFLHAFKVARNDPDDSAVNEKKNNELWAFAPPAVLPSFQAQYPGVHQLLLDGVPVIRDVVATEDDSGIKFERTAASAKAGTGAWRSVLVQSFGSSRGGYFAIDITNPVPNDDGSGGPEFLWQLTTDSAGNPLFGVGGATPLITTLFFDAGEGAREVAVAVLPGGSGGAPTGAACSRKESGPYASVASAFQPRSKVRCYDPSAVGGRSLTIVRLDTGEIVRTFRRSLGELPSSLRARGIETTLDAPITGQPVAFPAGTGAVADRIFVGDQEGTLWRVDVSSTDPDDWEMSLFFDGYPESLGHDELDSQPISTPPILSVDELGLVTVAFSTGDQEVFSATSDMTNYVWSLTESVNDAGTGFISKVNWYHAFNSGERVTGPMTLFDSKLFFSTYRAADSSAVCDVGTSAIWGMHYLTPQDPDAINQGGSAALPDPDADAVVQKLDASDLLGTPNASIFGVSVAQQPSCNDISESFNDPFLGFGTHTAISSISPGKFQLVMHTGTAEGDDTGQTNSVTVDLPTPATNARISSWAAIVE